MPSERQFCIDAVLDSDAPELVEPCSQPVDQRGFGCATERLACPEGERAAENLSHSDRVVGDLVSLLEQQFELQRIDVLVFDVELVSRRPGHDTFGLTRLSECPP